MSFIEAFFRAIAFLLATAMIVFLALNFGSVIQDMHVVSVNAETTQTLFIQQQETIRFLAQVNGETTRAAIAGTTSQVWAHEAGDSVRTVAAWLACAIVASVAAWQGGKGFRHWLTERNRERAILLAYADAQFPDLQRRRNVRIERVAGELMLRDYATRQQWPVSAAQAALAERGLLVNGETS